MFPSLSGCYASRMDRRMDERPCCICDDPEHSPRDCEYREVGAAPMSMVWAAAGMLVLIWMLPVLAELLRRG